MSTLTMPTIIIAFQTAAGMAIQRSQKGIVALIVRDAALAGKVYQMASVAQVPQGISAANKAAVRRAFLGYVNPPKKVLLAAIDTDDTIDTALDSLAVYQFDYLAGPDDLTAEEATDVVDWIKDQRTNYHAVCKAVLPNKAADYEGIINYITADHDVGSGSGYDAGDGKPLSAAAYCGRIAGLLAGTPMKISATYAPLSEVSDVDRMTAAAMDTAVGAGKLLSWYDGTQVKLGRAVNSLTTITGKSDLWKKIKIVELLDMVQHDIRKTAQDSFIGKYANSYQNKLLLVTAITAYLRQLADAELIDTVYSCDIDVDAQQAYLESTGVDCSAMTAQQIKEAPTGSQVFIAVNFKPLDAIEDITVNIAL